MANSLEESNLDDVLKPFYQRASEAEKRLSRLETALASTKGIESGILTERMSGLQLQSSLAVSNEELLRKISDLQSQLEEANGKLASERETVQKLTAENSKLQNRVMHLLQSAKELTEWKNQSGHYSPKN